MNVEHLLDVFMTIDTNSNDVWDVCYHFMEHLFWHKQRLVMLGPKIEALPDDHHSKPKCLFELSRLFGAIGNHIERKQLLLHILKLRRERGDNFKVAETLRFLSDANRWLGLFEEGIGQAREALEFEEWRNDKFGQAESWYRLARLLHSDKQLDAAEEAASRAINLFWKKAINSRSANLTISLAIYIATRARQRRQSTTSRQPSGSRPLSTGIVNNFGSISPWRSCSSMKTSSMPHTVTSNTPSHTQSTTRTNSVAR